MEELLPADVATHWDFASAMGAMDGFFHMKRVRPSHPQQNSAVALWRCVWRWYRSSAPARHRSSITASHYYCLLLVLQACFWPAFTVAERSAAVLVVVR